MGIHAEPQAMIRALRLGRGFTVCELGDQWVTQPERYPAEDFYKGLGCGRYVSIDGNGRGTVTLNLNLRPPRGLGIFDLVTDFGTGEHVFDQARVWRTVHDLARPDHGYIAFDRPVAGYAEHGFYNTQECLFRDLAAANGYLVVALERRATTRGEMIAGVFRRQPGKFRFPQQGRYKKALKI